jgi:hypothetical protein
VSNNVGIDFTELGPPHGTKPLAAAPNPPGQSQEKEELITIGFRVKPKEKAIIQDYVNRMYNQFIVDPNTKQPKRMLDSPSIGLMVKIATFSYMTQFNWFMQAMEQQQQQQQVPQNGPVQQQRQQGYGKQQQPTR